MKAGNLRRRGYSVVIIMVLLVLGASFATVLYAMVLSTTTIARNSVNVGKAQAAAESGLSYMMYQMNAACTAKKINAVTADDILKKLWTQLKLQKDQGQLAGTLYPAILWAEPATPGTSKVELTNVNMVDGASFSCSIQPYQENGVPLIRPAFFGDTAPQRYTMTITGTHGKTTRTIGMHLDQQGGLPVLATDLPIATNSDINVENNSSVFFTSTASEVPNTSSYPSPTPVLVDGLETDAIMGPGGMQVPSRDDELLLPRAPAELFPMLNQLRTSGVITNYTTGGTSATNIYIPANTNPNNLPATLNGIIYVGWPNNLTFGKSTMINGVIIYEPKPSTAPATTWPQITIGRKEAFTVNPKSTDAVAALANVGADVRRIIDGWAIMAPDVDLTVENGNVVSTLTFYGDVNIHSLVPIQGQGNASPQQVKIVGGSLIAHGSIGWGGNRQITIVAPTSEFGCPPMERLSFNSSKAEYWEKQ